MSLGMRHACRQLIGISSFCLVGMRHAIFPSSGYIRGGMNSVRLAAFAFAAVWGSVSASVIESDFAASGVLSSGGNVIESADGTALAPPNPGWHIPETLRYQGRPQHSRLRLTLQPLYPQREQHCGTFPGEHVRSICYPREGTLWFDR